MNHYQKLNKKQSINELRIKFKKKIDEKKKKKKFKIPSPPYDDIYFEGLKTLDYLAGEQIK